MEILPIDEATLAPELPLPAPEISPENPAIQTDEHLAIQNENIQIENVTNNTIKEKDVSIPKNITHAFKSDEKEM